jgi:biotin carboxyl carrier protein
VAQGDTFAAHDPLVVLESMKMEMTLSAPAPGQVTAVRCAPGDLVEMGATLLQLTEREDDGE